MYFSIHSSSRQCTIRILPSGRQGDTKFYCPGLRRQPSIQWQFCHINPIRRGSIFLKSAVSLIHLRLLSLRWVGCCKSMTIWRRGWLHWKPRWWGQEEKPFLKFFPTFSSDSLAIHDDGSAERGGCRSEGGGSCQHPPRRGAWVINRNTGKFYSDF